ncbi:cysteine hydrolase family protein [Pandoraea communis]|uniref:Hydrolase n=1 Tax=Pandoraea communis TaxID=2508297 RepID=A0A5E4SGH1_9BURK|nr:isochorismatase family protein [Pandoraea communis]MDM8358515.1 isochorismatase family protein [Pandoraea communis]VVD75006.1 hydrolase [Pandoraea communis]
MSQNQTAQTSRTVLLVIDAQESFRQRPYWREDDLATYFSRQQALVDGAVARGVPVVQVFHIDSGVFSRDSGFVRTLEELRIAPVFTVDKVKHSALAGSTLGAWLVEHGITRLIVSGIRTEQCCETTTRAASDAGYEVDFVTEATLTFPMQHPRTGRELSVADLKERTETVLVDRFARIVTVEEALAAV